ncbi:MAG: metallophosphatase [Bacteroidia bacterium]|nr:metallophosphatase [Bacteroidia bacterium]
MERREFLKGLVLGGMALTLDPLKALAGEARKSAKVLGDNSSNLTILHCNDVHSRIDAFPMEDPNFPGMGGYAKRASLVKHTRETVGKDNVLNFECGDMFQGTPYFNIYKGKLEISLMNEMGVDAVTIGNHEFDNGLDVLVDRMEEANFPFICSNYTFKNQRALNTVKQYQVFERAGKRIGVFGLGVKIEGLIAPNNADGTIYENPIRVANDMALYLKNVEKCDLVIALSHLGYVMSGNQDSDVRLAAASRNIDFILGGHTHTFLHKPEVHQNADGKRIVINQTGHSGLSVGRINVTFTDAPTEDGLAWQLTSMSHNHTIA